MKRLFLILLCLLFILLCGCKKNKVITTGSLTIWTQMEGIEPEIFEDIAGNFAVEYPEINLEIMHYQTEALRNNYQIAAATGTGPDIVYGPADNVGVFAVLKGGIIRGDMKNRFGKDFMDKFLPDALDNFTFKGKVWGLPDRIGNHLMLLVNTELVNNIPTDFETIFNTNEFKKDLKGHYPLAFNSKEPFWMVAFYGGYGGKVFKNNSVEPDLDNESMIKTLTFIKKLQDDGMITADLDYDTAHTLFIEGKSTMLINGDWSLGLYRDKMSSFVTAPVPSLPDGDFPRPYKSSKGFSINANIDGEQLALAVQFLKFFFSVENQRNWSNECNIFSSNNQIFSELNQSDDKIIQGSLAQLSYGEKMPINPEMRAIWDAIRPNLEAVLNGSKTPEQAATDMQSLAEASIKKMKGE